MAGRLFERLEQGVLGRDAERLGVVDDRDAPRATAWPRAQPRDKLAHLLDEHFATALGARHSGEVRMHARSDLHTGRATLASRRRWAGAAAAPRCLPGLAHRAILNP